MVHVSTREKIEQDDLHGRRNRIVWFRRNYKRSLVGLAEQAIGGQRRMPPRPGKMMMF